MLSKVANRIFWLSRYMERVENTARLIIAYTNLLLDLPKNEVVNWFRIIEILGAKGLYYQFYKEISEIKIMIFLLTKKENPASLIFSIKSARENARTTREVLPTEVWELINHMYSLVQKLEGREDSRSYRFKILKAIVHEGQRFEGIISEGMSRDNLYHFIRLGRLIERTDMTTRVLDVGFFMMKNNDALISTYDGIIWMNLLNSINTYQMYKKHVKNRMNAKDIVQFLLTDKQLPKSIAYGVETMRMFASQLPRPELVIAAISKLENFLVNISPNLENQQEVHQVMDEIQKLLIEIGNEIDKTWFRFETNLKEEEK